MPRIRTVKPEFWTDSKVVALSPEARLLFIGAWNFADDYGCLPEDPMQLKLRVLPADPVDAEKLVEELLSADLLEVRETSGGVRFWHITHWNRHQRVSHPKESDYGDPETWRKPTTREHTEPSSNNERIRETSGGFLGEGKGREGIEPNGSRPSRPPKGAKPDELAIHAVFEDLFGIPADTDLGLRRKAAKSLLGTGAGPGDVKQRAQAWPKLWGQKITLTPQALEKWWGQLGLIVEPPAVDCDRCGNDRLMWVRSDGSVTSADDPEAVEARPCPECGGSS